ncbi:MAG TPA: hypothetical protein PKE45_17920 [Caldilineaceae bacterium]|nr:hypothetical protein [Caldilineaceae bacterium]
MEQLRTAAMLMAGSHRLTGHIVIAGQRLQEILNNKLSACLTVYDSHLFRRTGAQSPVVQLPEFTIPKTMLDLVLLREEHHELPTKRLYAFVQKGHYPVFLTIAGYEVQGQLHLASYQKPERILDDAGSNFIPITQATVTCADEPEQVWETPVVFVRRSAIVLFYLAAPC